MSDLGTVLVIDDEIEVCKLVCAIATRLNRRCVVTTNASSFFAELTSDVALIVLDLQMPDLDGIELLRILAKQNCTANIVLMSGVGKRVIETAEQLAHTLGLTVVGNLQKPFRVAELTRVLETQTSRPIASPGKEKLKILIADDELHNAIERDEFVVHYHPQVSLRTGAVEGVEALVRWLHPKYGSLIYPDDFIYKLESLQLIDKLGWIVTERALSELGKLSSSYGAPVGLSLNLSAYSLHDLTLPDRLANLAVKYGVQMDQVTLEITESGLIRELSRALDVLSRLRLKQARLSIDDFGMGFSMMGQLENIPATELKIEKCFVQNMHTRERDRVMVQKTIEIGNELGLKVVAEGVESIDQLEYLRSRGCEFAQGYYFSRPLPLDEMESWLSKRRRQGVLN